MLTETDALGHITKYFYDSTNGELLAQINVDMGTGYVYDYTDWGVLEGVVPATGTASTYSEVTNAEKVDYEYDPNTNRLTQISTDSTVYSFSYDAFGNSTGVTAGNNTLATYEYYPNNGKLKKINYGNGFAEEYSYNSLELLDKIWYNYNDGTRELAYSYTYNNDGTLQVFTNHLDGTSIEYKYDVHGRFISASETNSSDLNYKNEYKVNIYDADGRVTRTTSTINYLSNSAYNPLYVGYQYTYNNDGTLDEERILSSAVPTTIIDYYYDSFNRTTKVDRRIDGFRYTTEYSYYFDSNKTNGLVSEVTNTINGSSTTYNYEYDSNGNITSISQGGNEVTYTYDDLGQLVSEQSGRVTRNYTYDNAGNIIYIQKVTESSGGGMIIRAVLPPLNPPGSTVTTVNLTYSDSEWGDLLTSYDGHAITYDGIGNPLTYYNGSAYTFTWEGRRLVGATKGSKTMSFTYDDNGIRTSKTVNGVTHTYQLNGSQIVSEAWGDKLLVYLYDASGSPIGMMYRTTSYAVGTFDVFWFEKNLQGDIVAVYNSDGVACVTYKYDAWGNCTESDILTSGTNIYATSNPFRYRGYYYDTDLGMYYLQSRYYDPNTCRFINADGYVSTGQGLTGYNMFAYCGNNPVMYTDASGNIRSHVVVCSMDDVGSASTRYSYSGGNILIVNGSTFNEETKAFFAQTYSNTIIVFDGRYCESDCQECNPNMQIYNSYIITGEARQREILEILVKHDQAHPSRHTWGRTVESMLIEWDAHNDVCSAATILKALGYNISQENLDRVMHTDFDYKDEKTTYKQYWDRVFEGVF